MKRIILSIIAVLSLTSCGTRQVHDKYYVKTLYISGKDRMTAKMTFFNNDSAAITASGSAFDEIKEKCELSSGKSIFTGHTEVIVLNDCYARETLDFMLNDWKVSPSCRVVLASKNADSITADVIDIATEQKKAPQCDIITILSDLNRSEAHTIYFNSDLSFQPAIISGV